MMADNAGNRRIPRSLRYAQANTTRGRSWFQYFVRLASVFALAITAGHAIGAAPTQTELVSLAIDSITRNYSLIKTAQLTIRQVSENTYLPKPGVYVRRTPSGRKVRDTIRSRQSPRTEWTLRIALRGSDIRVDRSSAASTSSKPSPETHAFVNGVWTQYVPDVSAAWIRRPEELPRLLPLDPRRPAADHAQRDVTDVLHQGTIVSAILTTSPEGKPLVRIVVRSEDGSPTTYDFAGEANFLPTRVMTRWPDGSLLQLVDIEYQDVLDGKAKFLKRMSRRFFAKGVTSSPTTIGWRQHLSQEVTGNLRLNDGIADAVFEVRLPSGTRVTDNIRRDVYTAHAGHAPEPFLWWWHTIGIIAALFVLVAVRRARKTDSDTRVRI